MTFEFIRLLKWTAQGWHGGLDGNKMADLLGNWVPVRLWEIQLHYYSLAAVSSSHLINLTVQFMSRSFDAELDWFAVPLHSEILRNGIEFVGIIKPVFWRIKCIAFVTYSYAIHIRDMLDDSGNVRWYPNQFFIFLTVEPVRAANQRTSARHVTLTTRLKLLSVHTLR